MARKSGVAMIKDRAAKVIRGLLHITKRDVLVGIPADTATRSQGAPITNAALGYIHETGAPEANIPARPFLMPGIRAERPAIAKHLKKAADASIKGDANGVERSLHAAGMAGMRGAQRHITSGPFVPLKPSTLAARRRRGRTGTKPLIDTGQLRRSITYVIRAD